MAKFWKPLLLCLAISPVLLFIGFMSAGCGHGNYILARILFPYAGITGVFGGINNFWITSIYEIIITTLFLLQYPLYGAVLGLSNLKGRLIVALMILSALHIILAGICFIDPTGVFPLIR